MTTDTAPSPGRQSTAPIRLGIVGCARILPAHLRGIAALQAAGFDPVRITALCARRLDDALMFRQRGEGPPPRPPTSGNERDPLAAPHRYVSDLQSDVRADVYDDWRDMLSADRVDAVLVLAPVALHHQIALDCLAAGKHVLVEKPFAITVRAAQAVVDAAADRGLVAAVAENARYGEALRATRWVLDQGVLGATQLYLAGGIGGEWAPDRIAAHTPWRHRKLDAGGGPAIDLGVHQMNQIRYLMGEVDRLTASVRTLEPVRRDGTGPSAVTVRNEVDDVYLAQLQFASGAIGSVFAGWAGRGPATGLDAGPALYGERGVIKAGTVFADGRELGRAADMMRAQAPASLLERYFPGGVTDTFALELLDFVDAIRTGSPLQTGAAEGTRDLATAYAMLESSLAGGPVRVEQVLAGSVAAYQHEIDEHYGLVD